MALIYLENDGNSMSVNFKDEFLEVRQNRWPSIILFKELIFVIVNIVKIFK